MDQFAISGFSSTNMIACYIDGENIIQQDYTGNRQIIGKTKSAYDELEGTTKQYYDKLVELKVIVPPKTQEQILTEMMAAVADLTAQVKELKSHDGFSSNTERSRPDVPKPEPEPNGDQGAASPSGNRRRSGLRQEQGQQPGAERRGDQ